MILVAVLVVALLALLAVGGVLNHWRNAGLWGVSDAMFQMRHDPLSDPHLLGFDQCFVRESSGGLFGDRPNRIAVYNPGPGDHKEIIEKVGQYASDHGWSHTRWNSRGYWLGTKRQHFHRSTIGIGIGPKDLPESRPREECWLEISMGA